ncbi:hypothetical protein SAMN02799630_00218 [Paenibacillus sp. UNCCL117]|uniref:DUF6710 family protein n=1 Tax=unclassified Paenibacillus TaxID=185978 RepID=UPI000886D747|nr:MULTISPECIES: DUF6710 family protein [unclassified Paenibacillus]SDC47980.1 hypothetical protein SAMN04488602_102313 [Paenibacillus sp. cl123]SFW12020.1 hypothetical protein SAMN02799630_00218 [Paenibacillus sp. UNCCL117]
MLKNIINTMFKKEQKKQNVYNKSVCASSMEMKSVFYQMLTFASDVIETHEKNRDKRQAAEPTHPIFDVIKLIGLRTQTKYLTNLLYNYERERLPNMDPWHVFFSDSEDITYDGKGMYDLFKKVSTEQALVSIKHDLVLPWPWDEGRQIQSLANIGEGRIRGSWTEDKLNHSIELWLPMRIGFVKGGNHSISAGILQGEGFVRPKVIFDISPIYQYVYTDGENFYRKSDNTIIAKVSSVEFAAIFEIGRYMIEKGINR